MNKKNKLITIGASLIALTAIGVGVGAGLTSNNDSFSPTANTQAVTIANASANAELGKASAQSSESISERIERINDRKLTLRVALILKKPASEIAAALNSLIEVLDTGGFDATDSRLQESVTYAQRVIDTEVYVVVEGLKKDVEIQHTFLKQKVDAEGNAKEGVTNLDIATPMIALNEALTNLALFTTEESTEVTAAKQLVNEVNDGGLDVWYLIKITHDLQTKVDFINRDLYREPALEANAYNEVTNAIPPVREWLTKLRAKSRAKEELKIFTPFVFTAIDEADAAVLWADNALEGWAQVTKLRVLYRAILGDEAFRNDTTLTTLEEFESYDEMYYNVNRQLYLIARAQGVKAYEAYKGDIVHAELSLRKLSKFIENQRELFNKTRKANGQDEVKFTPVTDLFYIGLSRV